jgi:hypothetical protein
VLRALRDAARTSLTVQATTPDAVAAVLVAARRTVAQAKAARMRTTALQRKAALPEKVVRRRTVAQRLMAAE